MCGLDMYHRNRNMLRVKGDEWVYKYISLKYLLSIVKDKKLRIDKVAKWDDPYENFFMKEDYFMYSARYNESFLVDMEEKKDRIYGQSWTIKEESDAMWRIYSSKQGNIEDKAVKIKIQVEKLFNLVYKDNDCMSTTWIGKVEYKTASEIQQWRENNNISNLLDFSENLKECLFMKRDSFEHEEEVRIIISKLNTAPADEYLKFDISDIDIFEEFILDPRLSSTEVEKITQTLQGCGINKNLIKKSDLYDFIPRNVGP